MSSAHARPGQATADQVHARLMSLAARVGSRVHDFRGDDLQQVRSMLLAIVGEVDNIAAAVKPPLAPAVSHGPVGEQTQQWMVGADPHVQRNRGQW